MLYQPYYSLFHPPPVMYRYRGQYSTSDVASARVRALGLGKSPGAHLVEKFTIRDKKEDFIRGGGTGTGNGRPARFINTSRDTGGDEEDSVVVRGCVANRECRGSEDGAERDGATPPATDEDDDKADLGQDETKQIEKDSDRQKSSTWEEPSGTKEVEEPHKKPDSESKEIEEVDIKLRTCLTKKKDECKILPDKPEDNPNEDSPKTNIEPTVPSDKPSKQEDKPKSDLPKTKVEPKGLPDKSEDKPQPDLTKEKVELKGLSGKQEDKPKPHLPETKVEHKGLPGKPEGKLKPYLPKRKVKPKGLPGKEEDSPKSDLSKTKDEAKGLTDIAVDNPIPDLPKTKGETNRLTGKPEDNPIPDLLNTKEYKIPKGLSNKPEDKPDSPKIKVRPKELPDRPEYKLKPDFPKTKEERNGLFGKKEDELKRDLTETKEEGKGLFGKKEDRPKQDLPNIKLEPKGLRGKQENTPKPDLPQPKLEPKGLSWKQGDKAKPDLPKTKVEPKGLPDKSEDKPKSDLPKPKVEHKGLSGKQEDKPKPDLPKTKGEPKGLPDLPKPKVEPKGLSGKQEDNPNPDLPKTKVEPKGLPDKSEDKSKPDLPKPKIVLKGLSGKQQDKPKPDLSESKLKHKGLSGTQENKPKEDLAKPKVELKGLTDKQEYKPKSDLFKTKIEPKGLSSKQEDKPKPDLLKAKEEPKGLPDKSEDKSKPGLSDAKLKPKGLSGTQEDKPKEDLPKPKVELKGLTGKQEDKPKSALPKTKVELNGLSDKPEDKPKLNLSKIEVEPKGLLDKPKSYLPNTKVEPKGLLGKQEDRVTKPDLPKTEGETKVLPDKPENKPKPAESKVDQLKIKEGSKGLLGKEEGKDKPDLSNTKKGEELNGLVSKPKKKPEFGLSLKKEEVGSLSDKDPLGHLGNEGFRPKLFKCTTHEDLTDPSKYDSDANNNDWEEVEVEEYDMEAEAVVKKKKVIVKKTGTQVKVTPLEAKPPKGGEMEVSIPGELMRQISKKRLSLVDEDLCRLVERKTSITDEIIVEEAAHLDSMIRVELLDRRKSSLGFPAIPEEVKEEEKKETTAHPVQDGRRAAWKRSIKTLGGFYKPQVQEDSSSSEDEECDVNCHRKCQLLMPNLCGVNQKLMAEALSRLQLKGRASTTSEQNANSSECSDSSESTAAGRVSPPAKTLPRFRSYSINDFQFLKVLGKGSFGKVLLAELKGSECYYAVKCLKKDVVLEDDDVECTLIERKVLALATGHPYFSHLFCTFQTESHLFFVMEYLNGGDLMFHIQQSGRFDEGRARFYAAEIVSGLSFLHKWGIVYRDLKLDNVLLDFDGHVRIADFGMCKLQIYLDKTTDTFCGTPDYMAPEVIKGLKYNQCADWWSFGILLYEMLVGQSPFSGCDEDDLFWSICNTRPHMPSYLSAPAKSILSDLMQKNWTKRLGSSENGAADVMNHAFFDGFKWPLLERKLLDPPFKPTVKHPLDTKYFDKVFTSEKPVLTPVDKTILESMDQTQFQGFSYTNPNATE
ncbi:protein piccolo-like isoform X2 [Cimex lectularius]|uniref:protein kinase C n=1 Tax=Cimex lectularius TaxID=79782 RepID=A0A8I6S5R8_CIMLE|nr:protein piccolo-like isoform X2 [Cimex lectularius]